jgi:ABC-2 type transport system permease protein
MALLIAVGAVMSLVTIMAIYREGGILKRLRATPLSPLTILGAHVVVKLAFALVSLVLLLAVGRSLFPGAMQVPLASFTAALLLSMRASCRWGSSSRAWYPPHGSRSRSAPRWCTRCLAMKVFRWV